MNKTGWKILFDMLDRIDKRLEGLLAAKKIGVIVLYGNFKK